MSIEAALKNGTAIPLGAVKNPVEAMLKQVLADVRAGHITTVGLIAVRAGGGAMTILQGPQAGDVFIGAASMQKKLLDAMEQPQKPAILRARAG